MRIVRVVVALILAIGGLTHAWRLGDNAAGIDFYQFWAGAQVARRVGNAIYDPETRKSAAEEYRQRAYAHEDSDRMRTAAQARRPELEFFSTPFLYTCFGVFGGGKYDRDFDIYRVFCLAATSAGVLLIAHGVGLSLAESLLLLAFVTSLFQPVRSDIRVGNVNQLQLLMAAGAIFLHSRSRFAAGALLGLAAAFKPNVMFAIPLAALRIGANRTKPVLDTSLIAGAFTGTLAAVAVSGLYFRSLTVWLEWLGAARNLFEALPPRSQGNVAIALPIVLQFGLSASWVIAVLALAIALFVLARRRVAGRNAAGIVIGVGLMIYLLSATLVWPHYLILALPLVIALLGVEEPMIRRMLALFALTLLAVDPWRLLLGFQTTTGESAVVWLGLIVLFATAIWRLARRPDYSRAMRSSPA